MDVLVDALRGAVAALGRGDPYVLEGSSSAASW